MGKVTKIFLIIATVCVVLGGALCATAFAMSDFSLSALSTSAPKSQQHYTADSNSISSITFVGVEDDLQIKRGDVENIEIDYWQNDATFYQVDEYGSPASLSIHLDTDWRRSIFVFNWPGESRPVIITVPQSFDGSLNLTTVSGDIALDKQITNLDYLEAHSVSGTVEYRLDKVANIKVETVSGTIAGIVTGDVDRATFNSVSADLKLEFGSVHTLDAHTVSGEINTYVLDKPADNYSFRIDTISGDIDVPASSKTAQHSVTYQTVSGSMFFRAVPALNPA
jgi:hypothetical protein